MISIRQKDKEKLPQTNFDQTFQSMHSEQVLVQTHTNFTSGGLHANLELCVSIQVLCSDIRTDTKPETIKNNYYENGQNSSYY